MKKKLKWITLSGIILLIAIVWLSNKRIDLVTNKLVSCKLSNTPQNKVGLLLGTSKYLKSGQLNEYFQNRIQATIELFKAGKIENIVISGDNSRSNYNEPLEMKNELIKLGVPEEKIYLDYAGFRTYDSVIRMNKIFGQSSFTVISQEFHNRRAVFIADKLNLKAFGYNAKDVSKYNGFKTKLREKFARVKVFLDLLINKQPKFLGEKIEIAALEKIH
jgi:SanA protein